MDQQEHEHQQGDQHEARVDQPVDHPVEHPVDHCDDYRDDHAPRRGRDHREVIALDVAVSGPHEPFVQAISFTAPSAAVTFVAVDPGYAQTALALALGGRVAIATGSVSVAGSRSRDTLQRRTRLVDVPDVTAPEESLELRHVVAEELALAERPSSRAAVLSFLAERDLAERARDRWDRLPAGTRTSLLLELGSFHPGAGVVVLTGPDRHGGDPMPWLDTAHDLARRGLTVIVICSPATAAVLTGATTTTTTTAPATTSTTASSTAGTTATATSTQGSPS